MKITSPLEGYTAKDQYGDVVLDFQDGVAEHDGDLPAGIRQYLAGAGYGLGSSKPKQPEPVEVPDPRDIEDDVVGTRLRDAAVDPHEDDFLAPVNAGEGNPHGPEVVSPEIHASGPAGILSGNVFVEDPAKQEKREKDYAEARLIDQTPAREAVADAVPDVDDFGPLGLSDPGSVAQGVEAAEEVASAEEVAAAAEQDDETSPEPAPAKKAAAKKTTAKKAAAKKS